MITTMSLTDAVLLVDDDEQFLSSVNVMLRTSGFDRVFSVSDSSRICDFMASNPTSVVVMNLAMPPERGLELVKEICGTSQTTRVIVTSPYNNMETALACMRLGACDYLIKPVNVNLLLEKIRACLGDALPETAPLPRKAPVRSNPSRNPAFNAIITKDKKMEAIFRYVEAIAVTSQTVMVTGETGTGKELVARALHDISERSGEYVSVNVAGLDDLMFSDSLFGHSRGAFTGADRERKGLIEKAAGGTLFLDEIGDLNNSSQVKLLRLLQEGEYYPLGSDSIKNSSARIVVATNCNLEEKMAAGTFRSDLFYRLCSHHIHLPSLRERAGDIPMLVQHFLDEAADYLGRSNASLLSQETLDQLLKSDFPGNIRELRGIVSNAAAVAGDGPIAFHGLKPRMGALHETVPDVDFSQVIKPFGRLPTLKEAEDYLIEEAIKASSGNQRAAAVLLGITRQALNKRLLRNPQYLRKR